MTQTGPNPRLKLAATAGYFYAYILTGMIVASLGPSLPTFAANTLTPLKDIGVIFSAYFLGRMTGAMLLGRFYDRIPGHRLLSATLFSLAVIALIVPHLRSLYLLIALLYLFGTACGSLDVGGNTLLVWTHGSRSAPYVNALHLFFGLGAFSMPLLIAWSLQSGGRIQTAYQIIAVLLLAASLWFLRLPSPARARPAESGGAPRVNPAWIALLVLFMILSTGIEATFGGWIYTYAIQSQISSPAAAAWFNSAFWIAMTAGRLIAIGLSTRVRPAAVISADILGCILSVSVFLLWPASPAAAWAGTILLGLSMASLFPTGILFTEERVKITGSVTGWIFIGDSLGGVFLPWIAGQLMGIFSPQAILPALLVDLLLAAAVFALMLRSKNAPSRTSP